jgi:U3 small nucleolar RNA-associated protein 20
MAFLTFFSSLLQKLTLDLRTTLSPVYSSLLEHLFGLFSRTLSAQALASLLETLSSLFRFLLIPAVNPKLLDETWNVLCSVLPTCLAEIQRAVAEVWAGVLRRLKTTPRDNAVLLLATTTGLEDATAWTIVFSCKVSLTFSVITVN